MARSSKLPPSHFNRYWDLTQRPLHALVFLLPLMVCYELALPLVGVEEVHGATVATDIYARSLVHQFFEWFGVFGYYLPGLIVVAVLLCWHLFRQDPWRLELSLYPKMAAESILLAVPLFVFMLVLARQPQLQMAVAGGGANWPALLVFSLGAGVYEEFLFRLVVIALVHMLAVDVMGLSDRTGLIAAVGVSALTFALYHFSDRNPFAVGRLAQYTLAGLYLAGVYLMRGFGIVAATHAIYDIMAVTLHLSRD